MGRIEIGVRVIEDDGTVRASAMVNPDFHATDAGQTCAALGKCLAGALDASSDFDALRSSAIALAYALTELCLDTPYYTEDVRYSLSLVLPVLIECEFRIGRQEGDQERAASDLVDLLDSLLPHYKRLSEPSVSPKPSTSP